MAEQCAADEKELMRSGTPLLNEQETRADANGTLRTFLTTKLPLKDEQGKVFGLVVISRDITARSS